MRGIKYVTLQHLLPFQIANIGPLTFVPLSKMFKSRSSHRLARCLQPPERLANYVILFVGFLACVLLAHLWNVSPSPVSV